MTTTYTANPDAGGSTKRDILEDRWHMATTSLQRFENEPYPSIINSKQMNRLTDDLRWIAIRMLDNGINDYRPDEGNLLEDAETEILGFMKDRLMQLAVEIEASRPVPRAVAG